MASFYNTSAAKVAPECLSPPAHPLMTHVSKKSQDSSPSPDLLNNPLHKPPPPHDLIKPVTLTFDKKIRLSPTTEAGAVFNPTIIPSNPDSDKKQVISSNGASQVPATPEGKLWPKQTELEDRPPTPSHQGTDKEEPGHPPILSEKTQAKSDPTYLFPKQTELDDRPPSPPRFKPQQAEVISEPAYHTKGGNRPSSPPYENVIKSRMPTIREADYRLSNQAECKSDEPKMQMINEDACEAAAHDDKLSEIKESYKNPAKGRLSRVVEESESFSRREFGANVLSYMSTHSSANHAADLSNYSSYTHSNISYKYPSCNHNSHSDFSYPRKPPNFMNSKSAPAGSTARMRSSFALFRRGSSEGGKLGNHVAYHGQRSRKSRSLGGTLLRPLVKIRNGYVGCMMGLEGSGDLAGMAQGSTYATTAQYFADVPLSKTDSRNYG